MTKPNMYSEEDIGLFIMCTSHLDLSYRLLIAQNRDHMQNLCPQEVDISTNNIRAHKPLGISSSRVRFLDV
jgi:hypothetical protein